MIFNDTDEMQCCEFPDLKRMKSAPQSQSTHYVNSTRCDHLRTSTFRYCIGWNRTLTVASRNSIVEESIQRFLILLWEIAPSEWVSPLRRKQRRNVWPNYSRVLMFFIRRVAVLTWQDLSKIESFRTRFIREKATVDAQLKAGIRAQLEITQVNAVAKLN